MSANPAQSNPPTGATEHSLAPSAGSALLVRSFEWWRDCHETDNKTMLIDASTLDLKPVWTALGLLNSMVLSGENHSDQSRAVFVAALERLREIDAPNSRINKP